VPLNLTTSFLVCLTILLLLLLLQALQFLVLPHKGSLSLEELAGQVCPSLSHQQLYRLCTTAWDESPGQGEHCCLGSRFGFRCSLMKLKSVDAVSVYRLCTTAWDEAPGQGRLWGKSQGL
jgi:hypothetical protein